MGWELWGPHMLHNLMLFGAGVMAGGTLGALAMAMMHLAADADRFYYGD